MSKIPMLKSRVKTDIARISPHRFANKRTISGSQLQKIRMEMWVENPYCCECGKLTSFPSGFEVDHIYPIADGGRDTPENRQILCTSEGNVKGCHHIKSVQEEQGRAHRKPQTPDNTE